MQHDSASPDFFFDDELEDFNPRIEEVSDDITPEKPTENATFEHPDLALPAPERIEKLMTSMNSTSRTLRSIIAFCVEPQAVADVNAHVDEQQKNHFSVYSAATLCGLLERAGAITREDESGTPIGDEDAQPGIVVEDGVEYLEAPAAKPSFWHATPDGLAALEGPDVSEQLAALIACAPSYEHIYRKALSLCSDDVGASMKKLSDAIDDDPAVQDPRRYASYFVDKLEACEAIEWFDGAWHTTETGIKALA